MSEKTLENSYVLRGKITSMQAPDKSLTKEGVPADAKAVGDAIQEAVTGIPSGGANAVFGHIESQSNPHNVTKAQVGLGNVDNTSDMDKPVSTAQQAAINAIGEGLVGQVNEHEEAIKQNENDISDLEASKEGKKLEFTDTVVQASSFLTDSTYSDKGYGYRASVALTGVTASMTPDVTFDVTEAISGNYAPVADSYDGGIYLYAVEAPSSAITIPTILVWEGNDNG